MLTCPQCEPTGHWRGGACRGRGELCGAACAVRTPPAGSGCRGATGEAAPHLRGRACSPAPVAPGSRSPSWWELRPWAPRLILLWAPLLVRVCSCRQEQKRREKEAKKTKNSACGLIHQWVDHFNSHHKQEPLRPLSCVCFVSQLRIGKHVKGMRRNILVCGSGPLCCSPLKTLGWIRGCEQFTDGAASWTLRGQKCQH